MNQEFLSRLYKAHRECPDCPSPEEVTTFFVDILGVLFPDHSYESFQSEKEFEFYLDGLKRQFEKLLITSPDNRKVDAKELVTWFFDDLQHIHARLMEDVMRVTRQQKANGKSSALIRAFMRLPLIASPMPYI
jgi:serine O-acetyltransferase